MRSYFSVGRVWPAFRAAGCVAVLLTGIASSQATNIAPSGTGTIGQTADPALNGTENDHAGSNTAINDNNPASHVDNFPGGGNSYAGVTFASPANNVQSVGLIMAMFVDGGWFGPSGASPGAGNPLTPADLTAPVVQITTDGTNWTTVASSNDYVGVMTGAPIGGGAFPNPNNSPLSTFTLNSPANGVEGIRLLGNGGGVAGNGGFIGISEIYVNAVPEPSTLCLAALGVVGLVAVPRRRRS